MARSRRRSGRSAANGSQEEAANEENEETTPPDSQGAADAESERKEEDKCPACKEDTQKDWNEEDKESWVRCDACKTWFHWRCAGEGELEAIGKWYAYPTLQRMYAFECQREAVIGFASHVAMQIQSARLR